MPPKSDKNENREKARVSKIIVDLLDNAFSVSGTMRPYEDVESDFLRLVRCPITFSQNKCHLAAVYKLYQRDALANPNANVLKVAARRIPSIRAYEKLVASLFLDPAVSSVVCADKKNLVGDVDLRFYAVSLLFFAASGIKRQMSDSLLALCLSGPTSFGKSKVLDAALSDAKVICQDAKGVGRFSGCASCTTLYYSDVALSDILGSKENVFMAKHILRGECVCVKTYGGNEKLDPKHAVLCSNECFFTHRHQGQVVSATIVPPKRGIENGSTAYRDFEAHDKAIRMRIIEVRLFNRPELEDGIIHGHKDLSICRMGLFRVMMKLLIKNGNKPIRCKSPYFLPMLSSALKSLAHDYSVLVQNKLPASEYEVLLLARIDQLFEMVSPPATEDCSANASANEDEDEAGLSMFEDDSKDDDDNAAPTAVREEESRATQKEGNRGCGEGTRRRQSSDWYPIFRSKGGCRRQERQQSGGESEAARAEKDIAAAAVGEENGVPPPLLTSTPIGKQRRKESTSAALDGDSENDETANEEDSDDPDATRPINDWNCEGNNPECAADSSHSESIADSNNNSTKDESNVSLISGFMNVDPLLLSQPLNLMEISLDPLTNE